MEMSDLLNDIQRSIDLMQSKINVIRTLQTGTPYELDIFMTRKEAACFVHKSIRQFDRLCAERKIRREYVDGALRFRKSELMRYNGLDIRPTSSQSNVEGLSDFHKIIRKYK